MAVRTLLAVAPVPVVLARRLRRRRITRLWLLGAVAAFWLALLAVGLDAFLQERFPTYDRGSYNAGTIIYPAIVAVVLALTWRSIRRWLPRTTPPRGAGGADTRLCPRLAALARDGDLGACDSGRHRRPHHLDAGHELAGREPAGGRRAGAARAADPNR